MLIKKTRWVFWTMILLSHIEYVMAQKFLSSNFSIEQGLSQNSVYSSVVTKDGFIWLATQDGLNRFDGKNFKAVIPQSESEVANFSKFITHLYIDNNNVFFVATTSGIFLFDNVRNKFENPTTIYKNLTLPIDTRVNKILESIDNKIWFLTIANKLYYYDKINQVTIEIRQSEPISDIGLDKNANLVFSSKNNFYVFNNGQSHSLYKIKSKQEISNFTYVDDNIWLITTDNELLELNTNNHTSTNLQNKYRLAILTDPRLLHNSHDGLIWIGSRSKGVFVIDSKNNMVKNIELNNGNNSGSTQFIMSINSFKNFTLIGHNDGGASVVYNAMAGISSFKSQDIQNKGMLDNMIFSLFVLNEEKIYAGTLTAGLLEYDTKRSKHKYYTPQIGESLKPESKNIYSIIKIDNNLWMASYGGILKFDLITKKFTIYNNPKDARTKQLTTIFKIKGQNKVLLSGWAGGILVFNLDTKLFEECLDTDNFLKINRVRVRHFEQKENGDIFASSENKSFLKYNIVGGKFTLFPHLQSISATSRHFCFHNDKCYIATDRGIVVTDTIDYKVSKRITMKEGLPNNIIYAIKNDSDNNLWISSSMGLSRYNNLHNTILNFTNKQGLQGLEFNTASVAYDINNNIYFGGTNGFTRITPKIVGFDQVIKRPILNEILIMNQQLIANKDLNYVDTIRLKHNENFITLGFQALYNASYENTTYRYKLIGIDPDWISLVNRNYVSYSDLSPGTYQFNVCSYNINDTWSEAKQLTIIITPAWYQSWLLRTGAILLMAILLFYFGRRRLDEIKQQAAKEKDYQLRINNLELDNLRSQMNPHFMFNALNSINRFIIENDVRKASNYLTKFSRLMRMILDHTKQSSIPLSNEIEALELYLLVESNRFTNKFVYTINSEDGINLNSIMIPPLIIQPYVENAIWHGLAHKNEAGKIEINIRFDNNDFLELQIIDNGIGRNEAGLLNSKSSTNKKSYGMDITLERIMHASKENKVKIEDLTDLDGRPSGTKITITLNIK